MRISFNALIGINTNWSYGINSPNIAEISGILNVLLLTGIFVFSIFPFFIWHCGTVGEIKG